MQTVAIHGTDGEIMVPFGNPGTFIRGKRIGVIITKVAEDKDIPLLVKEALIGLPIDAVLTREQVINQCGSAFGRILPEECLLAYVSEVITVLHVANRHDAANALKQISDNTLDMYTLEKGTFRLLD